MPVKRRRLADRAAGVGAGRRRHAGAPRPRPPSRPSEPPGTRLASHGLRTGPKAEFSFDEPIANSSMLILPSVTVPAVGEALRRRCASNGRGSRRASASRRWCARPRVTKMSLCAIGTPGSGAGVAARRGGASAARAPARARASASTRERTRPRRSCAGDAVEQMRRRARRSRARAPPARGRARRRRARAARRSLDHLRHEVQAVLDRRRARAGWLALVGSR